MTRTLKGRQVLILASIDWGAAWQRHQAWAAAFAEQGAEVFFVENTGFRDIRLDDFSRVTGRLRRLFSRPTRAGSPPPKGVRVLSPLVLPPTGPFFRAANAVYLLPFLLRRLRRRGLKPGALVFAYLPTATTLRLIDLAQPSQVVYDCVDNFAGHPTPPADLRETEDALLARADTVLTTASTLYEDKVVRHPRVRLIHHGADPAFLGAPRRPGPVRSLCYFGTVWSALDYEAVAALAEAGYRVVLAGPTKEPPPPLPPGVELVAPMPHARLPAFLSRFDGLLLPYRMSDYNRGVVPAKLYECLATGLPVLSAALPALAGHAEHLYLARSPADFPAAARRAEAEDDTARSAARIAAARAHATPAQALRLAEFLGPPPHAPAARRADAEPAEFFLRGLSWIAALFAMARASTLIIQFVAARVLGPAEYGAAHILLAVAALAHVAPMMGFPLSLSHFTAAADERRAGRVVATGLAAFAAWALLCAAAGWALSPRLAALAGLSDRDWALAGVLALATATHHVAAAALQGLGRFRERGAVEALYGAVALAVLCALLAGGQRSHDSLIAAYIVGLAAACLLSPALVFRRLRPSFDAAALSQLLPYAGLGTAHVLAAALVQAPGRLLTFHHLDAAATGHYSAYFNATVQLALALGTMLQTVLVPLASRAEGRRESWEAARRVLPGALGVGWCAFSAAAAGAVLLLGREYPMRPDWIVLFGAAGALVLVHGGLGALYSARGLGGLRVAAAASLACGLANLAGNLLLTPRFGTTGAAAALCLAYGGGLAWYARRLYREEA